MNERRKAVLELRSGEEDHPKLSKIGRPDSMLLECYAQAIESVNDIIQNTQNYHAVRNPEEQNEQIYNYHNNLVIFSASRGCGKTSAMLTFSRFLRDSRNKHDEIDSRLRDNAKSIEQHHFIVIQPIDPTVLDEQHDIVSLILSRLLHHANEVWKQEAYCCGEWNDNTQRQTAKAEIVRLLRGCQSAVLSLKKSRNDESAWSLDYLSDLGSVVDLKKHFYLLVKKIIELEGYGTNNCHIVLQIDDADMNFSYVNSMLESIRNFLMVPNVIILMAADMEMISKIVYNKYLKDYRDVGGNEILDPEKKMLSQFTEQYILKFFPPKRQIHLPGIQEYTQIDKDNLFYRQEENESPISLEQGFLDEIFKKTGLVFAKHTDYHYILPTTQRGIGQLMAYLNKMGSVKHLEDLMNRKTGKPSNLKCEIKDNQFFYYASFNDIETGKNGEVDYSGYVKQLEVWKNNVQMFQDYFLNEWIGANLSMENQSRILRLHAARLSEKNATVIKLLCGSIEGAEDDKINYHTIVKKLTDYQMKAVDEQLRFAVQTYYSILAQQIVLAKLSEYYSGEQKTLEETLCSFDLLSYLFGSSLIFTEDAELEVMMSTPSAKQNAKTKLNVKTKWNETWDQEWFTACENQASGIQAQNELYQTYAASLLMDGYFEDFSQRDSYPMNIYAPIMNCLYVKDVQSRARSLQFETKNKNVVNQESVIKRIRYMQDTALRIVVNCDYHQEIKKIRTLPPKGQETYPNIKPQIAFNDMVFKDFYDAVSMCVFNEKCQITLDNNIVGTRMRLGLVHWKLDRGIKREDVQMQHGSNADNAMCVQAVKNMIPDKGTTKQKKTVKLSSNKEKQSEEK